MKAIDVMYTRTNDGDYIADFDCSPSELPESNVFFFQAINAVDLVRAETAERTAAELKMSIDGICDLYETQSIVAAVATMHAERKEAAELRAQLATVTAERDAALNQLAQANAAASVLFENQS